MERDMHSYRLIQIGDIHYSKAIAAIFKDSKDQAFPSELALKTTIGPYRQAIRSITKARDSQKGINGVIFCGDLSTFGNYAEYQEAVKSLKKSLSLDDKSKWNNGAIIVVPGNHDIDRKKIDHSSDNYKEKFKDLEKAWSNNGCEFFKYDDIDPTITNIIDNTNISIFPLNSCIGCGEKRCYPEDIRDAFHNILKDYAKKKGDDDSFKLLGEDLDTPAFLEKDINSICDYITDNSTNSVPILVSHHNLLPQTIPRFDMYTELLNSGFVRSRLGKCGAPILYCHAHIHSDPIEKIIDIKNNGHPIITVSAPKITEGFNILDIKFNNEGTPLGCTVEMYRISNDGHTDLVHKNISFVSPKDSVLFLSSNSKDLIAEIPSGVPFRYKQLVSHLTKAQDQIDEEDFVKCLIEAYWFGLLEINNIEKDNNYWHVEKVVP